MRKLMILFLAIAMGSLGVNSAEAAFKHHVEQNIDHHQVGYVDIAVDDNGNASITHKWSNGKQWAGNRFYSIVQVMNAKGDIIFQDAQWKGLNGSYGGRAREGSVTTKFHIKPEYVPQLEAKYVTVRMGAGNCGVALKGFKTDKQTILGIGPLKCPSAPEDPKYHHVTPPHRDRLEFF